MCFYNFRKLKVAMMVLFLVVAGGISTYFLYPRQVEIYVAAHSILAFSFEGNVPWMEYSVRRCFFPFSFL